MSKNASGGASSGWLAVLQARWFPWVVIPIVWALAYLPQLNARDLRHEEGRRATPAAEMLRSHDFIMPTIYGEPYLNKPPLYFWIAAGLGALQGEVSALSVRIPSVLSVLLGAWLIANFARRELTREARFLGALIFLSLPIMLDKGTLGEIDAFLSLLTFACFAALWAGYNAQTGRIALWAWTLSGIMMALAVLTKGPGGPLEFYAIFIPFLFLAGRAARDTGGGVGWKLLISPGHFLMIALAAVPMLIWAGFMLTDSKLGAGTVISQWADQLGLGKYFPASAKFAAEREPNPESLQHYLSFLPEVFTMLLPWSLFAIYPTFPAFARRAGLLPGKGAQPSDTLPPGLAPQKNARDLWILLAVSAPALILIFWAWPMAKPRHMMMIAYPVSVLVAVGVTSSPAWPKWPPFLPLLKSLAEIFAMVLIVIGVATIVAAIVKFRAGLPVTCIVAAASAGIGGLALLMAKRTTPAQAPLAFAANLAILIMLARGTVMAIVIPAVAPSDTTRILHEQIDRLIPPQFAVYTTRTLLSGKGDSYFNPQFYIPGGALAISDFASLPPDETLTVILAPNEWEALLAVDPAARKLGELTVPNTRPPKAPDALWVARTRIPPKQPADQTHSR